MCGFHIVPMCGRQRKTICIRARGRAHALPGLPMCPVTPGRPLCLSQEQFPLPSEAPFTTC